MHKRPVMIMAGGTGGHVFPGIAVANLLREKNIPVAWMGTRQGIESRVVEAENIPLHYISVSGIRGKGKLALVKAPFVLLNAIQQSLSILRKEKPRCVIGMGGFASGPGGIAAWLLRIPLLIHEQNAVAGTTNRILSRFANKVLMGFPNAFASKKALFVGNPVRQSIQQVAKKAKVKNDKTNLLILGGSLGAQTLNSIVPQAISELPENTVNVWHQTGRGKLEAVQSAYQQLAITAKQTEFIDSMEEAYHWADIIVCRAGALTIAEVATCGVPAIFIPLPSAIDNHQFFNAKWLVEQKAAYLIEESQLTAELLSNKILSMTKDSDALAAMSKASRHAIVTNATEAVMEACLSISLEVNHV